VLDNSVTALGAALMSCRDPLLDTALRQWCPAKYAVPRVVSDHGLWIEYYLGDRDNRGRALAVWDRQRTIVLVARTAIHDHGWLVEAAGGFVPPRPETT
jgi:hypothetical protein